MYTVFNAQFPNGRECETLEDACTYLPGWLSAWVEDANGNVVEGKAPANRKGWRAAWNAVSRIKASNA